jgi:hypothetical protein
MPLPSLELLTERIRESPTNSDPGVWALGRGVDIASDDPAVEAHAARRSLPAGPARKRLQVLWFRWGLLTDAWHPFGRFSEDGGAFHGFCPAESRSNTTDLLNSWTVVNPPGRASGVDAGSVRSRSSSYRSASRACAVGVHHASLTNVTKGLCPEQQHRTSAGGAPRYGR